MCLVGKNVSSDDNGNNTVLFHCSLRFVLGTVTASDEVLEVERLLI